VLLRSTHMERALELAQCAARLDEVPVGAVVVDSEQRIIAEAHNEMRARNDATAHAEFLAIGRAMRQMCSSRLEHCDLYVTLEPCTMCAGAIAHARLRRIYYAAEDVKGGAVDNGVRFFTHPSCLHKVEAIGGLYQVRAEQLLAAFFSRKTPQAREWGLISGGQDRVHRYRCGIALPPN